MLQRAALQSGCQWRGTIRLWGTKARAGRLLPLSAPSPTPTFFRIPDFHLSHRLPAGCPAGSFRLTARISNQVGHKASIQGPSPGYKPPTKVQGSLTIGKQMSRAARSSNTGLCASTAYGQAVLRCCF